MSNPVSEWMKRRLRAWLLEADPPAKFSPLLDCGIDGRVVTFRIIGRAGIGLKAVPLGCRDESVRILMPGDALDPVEFEEKWKHFVGEAKIEWE